MCLRYQHQVHAPVLFVEPLINPFHSLLGNAFAEPYHGRAKKIIFTLGAVREVREWDIFNGNGLHPSTGLWRRGRLLLRQGRHDGCVPILSLVAAGVVHTTDAEERSVEIDDLPQGVTGSLAQLCLLVSNVVTESPSDRVSIAT